MLSGRYLFVSSNPIHWIALGNEFLGSNLLCSPAYGQDFLAKNMDTIRRYDGVVPMFFDQSIEELFKRVGVPLCFPSARVRAAIEDKCEAVRLARHAGVRIVPTVLAKVTGYEQLRDEADRAALGKELVVQVPKGNSGRGTFTIGCASDYLNHAELIETAAECRVMSAIANPQSFCIETVMTDAGTVMGRPALDLIGIPELTPNPDGWCGNVIGNGIIHPWIVKQIREDSLKISAATRFRHPNFFGYSGDDYLLSPGEDQPVYQEKNARCTGMMPLSNIAAMELGLPPLIAQHLMQYEGKGKGIDVDALNHRWSATEGVGVTSCLIIKQLDHCPSMISCVPKCGIYTLNGNGLQHCLDSIDVKDLLGQSGCALWIPETGAAQVQPQDVLGRLLVRERVTDGNQLNPRGKDWIRGMRELFVYCV